MSRISILVIALALAAPVGPASAAPAVDGIFDLPGVQTNGQLTVGPDGNVWVSLEAAVAKVAPNGTVVPYASAALGNKLGFPQGGITSADGAIWITQTPSGGKKAIVRIPPADPASATDFDVTDINANATAMATGPDGNIWVALADKIVRFSPSNPAVATTFSVPGLAPRGITAAGDGTLWVTDTANGGRLVNVTTAGVVTPYPVGGQPQFVAGGPSAQIAYGNPNNAPQQIGLLSPGGSPLTLDRPNGSDPFGVTFGADGAFWVAEFAGNRLARVTTDGQLTTLSGFPAVVGQGPRQITAGPGNTLWATLDKPGDSAATKIARITGVDPPVVDPGPTPGGGTIDPTPTGATPPPPDTTPPAITLASLSKTVIRAGTRAIQLRFTLSEPAAVKLTLSRAAPGKRRGKTCVKPTARLRKARRCTRFVRVRAVSTNAIAGQNTLQISTRRLRIVRYRVVLAAADAAGNRAVPLSRTFNIAKKPR
jgi:streptogramin lyase